MKSAAPTSSQRKDQRRFPLIDWQYHVPLESTATGAKPTCASQPLRPIWKLSAEFLGTEAARDYAKEFAFFSLITGLSFWPIITMLIAVVRMIRNY